MTQSWSGKESDWTYRASLGGLAAVLDEQDATGAKNRLIDRAHKRALATAIGRPSGLRVLDFGCGNGRISAWLSNRGASVHGLDASPEMVELARDAVPDARFDLVEGDTLPVDDSSYDLVVSVGVLLYIAPDPERLTRVVMDLARVVTPDGRIVALEQVHSGSLPRGAPLTVYQAAFSRAGLTVTSATPVRRSDSRLFGMAAKRPLLSRLPLMPALVQRDARAGARRVGAGAYAEYLFVANA